MTDYHWVRKNSTPHLIASDDMPEDDGRVKTLCGRLTTSHLAQPYDGDPSAGYICGSCGRIAKKRGD